MYNVTFSKNEKYITADAIKGLERVEDKTIDTCITSPPYYRLRDYNIKGQIGLEETPGEYIKKLVEVFREVKRVLKDDGTLWVVIADSYAGSGKGAAQYPESVKNAKQGTNKGMVGTPAVIQTKTENCKPKDLIGIPWMLAFALRDDGWYLRQDIIWNKLNPMPESVKDRCTKAHEYVFLLSKNRKYYFNTIKEPANTPPTVRDKNAEGYQADYPGGERFSSGARVYGEDGMRTKRSVWNVGVSTYRGTHFATFPPELIRPCILAGSREGGIVLDPFFGSGTTGVVALEENRRFIGIELNPENMELAKERISESRKDNEFGEDQVSIFEL